MATPVVLKWFKSVPKVGVSFRVNSRLVLLPVPDGKYVSKRRTSLRTTKRLLRDVPSFLLRVAKSIFSMTCSYCSFLSRSEDGEYLLLEGNGKKGYCNLHYCEIEWMDSFKDEVRERLSVDPQSYSQLKRIIPFSLPSLECCDDLRINHITMQPLRVSEPYGPHPAVRVMGGREA